ncbi:hypothetical protein C9374_004779 [Naegleria lovaniensis]|uniref:Uncharacterized protein n=1 Tax=Naegleria lovaniensis TaxID=51637 RepID=A0AA88GQT7_NAELO|nr:uncharacterized protein C9374_004779 [Naegleria lovaniensis]KAG2382812.1 hypothetical protein C9374_004779 [Naegleria lovaniensis]
MSSIRQLIQPSYQPVFCNDTLTLILNYLDSKFILCVGMKVSKQWYMVCLEIPMTSLDLSFKDRMIHTEHVEEQTCHIQRHDYFRKMNDEKVSNLISHPCLALNIHLTHLDVSFHDFGDVGASIICNSKCVTHLKLLRLACNGISNFGFIQIIHSFYLKNLIVLQLHHNEISDEGAVELANSEMFRRLECLDLSYNKIGDLGAKAIANVNSFLEVSNVTKQDTTKLTTLIFTGNPISQQGSRALHELLKKRLQVLYVERPFELAFDYLSNSTEQHIDWITRFPRWPRFLRETQDQQYHDDDDLYQ